MTRPESPRASRYSRVACGTGSGSTGRPLAAYNLRPTRAEPLHALAEHYRLNGRNEASGRLAEVGLALPMPNDLLFVDEHVYRYGLRQSLSISGFHATQPARRARARALCAELAVERDAPAGVRAMARSNWRYYALGSEAMFGCVRFEPIGLSPSPGYRASTPTRRRPTT